ncbi:hypothetical protein KGM_209380 [Danaus plexippus plexippus]|uniref:Uncharacterized protein n=1 Tax=Danaus plexippus plexippus TaxID=278856 RepID=A0A212FF42_DANPL|nr:hypothetical protein KGM_209380 [Danaus plexippus plexippus]
MIRRGTRLGASIREPFMICLRSEQLSRANHIGTEEPDQLPREQLRRQPDRQWWPRCELVIDEAGRDQVCVVLSRLADTHR